MMVLGASLLELKSKRAHLEIQLLAARRKLGDLERENARLQRARRRGEIGAHALQLSRDRLTAVADEVEELQAKALELDHVIGRIEHGEPDGGVHHLLVQSLQLSAELEKTRSAILDTLRALAEPLRNYQYLADRQKWLTSGIREATGKDNSYAAYIDTALLRTGDYDDELEFVIEMLKRTPVVA